MPKLEKRILAVVSDLFFSVKIGDVAKRSGMSCDFVKDHETALQRALAEQPALMILDLNFDAAEPVKLIGELKGKPETRGITLIAFVSHIQAELKQAAQEAGCNMVLARSAFSQNLPMVLRRHSGQI